MRVVCCVCGKQVVSESPPPWRNDKYCTKKHGSRAGFRAGECFCGYCAEEMDENGLFPEEAMMLEDESTIRSGDEKR